MTLLPSSILSCRPFMPKVCVLLSVLLCAIPLCSLVATQPTRAYVTKLYLCCFVLRQSETGRSMLCRTWYCCSF